MINILKTLSVLLLFTELKEVQAEQDLYYTLSDILTIRYGQKIDFSNSLAVSATQYLDEGWLEIIQNTLQIPTDNNTYILYNILYFNLSSASGSECYFQYFSENKLPNYTQVSPCSSANIDDSVNKNCINFTNCMSENFTYITSLSLATYKQNIIMLENSHPSNTEKLVLKLLTNTKVNVYNYNYWFYGSVALASCLVLLLVFLTGVVLYWSLKYKKAKRALQQLKLTQVDEEREVLRKSFRQSLKEE